MSLLIKALQKAEQSKEGKSADSVAEKAAGLTLELTPQDEEKPNAYSSTDEPAAFTANISGLTLEESAPQNESIEKSESKVSSDEPTKATTPSIAPPPKDEDEVSLADEAGFALPVSAPTAKPIPSSKKPVTKAPVNKVEPSLAIPDTAGTAKTIATETTPKIANEKEYQQIFAAGLLNTGSAKPAPPTNRRSLWLGLSGLTLLLLLGVGFYYYLETLDQSQLIAATNIAPRPPKKTDSNPSSSLQTLPAANSVTNPPISTSSMSTAIRETPKPTEKPLAKFIPQEVASAPSVLTKAPAEPTPLSIPRKRQATLNSEGNAVQVAKLHRGEPVVDATHVAAYQAYSAGDDVTASRLYRQVVQSEPRNVDAWLGLAAVSARLDKTDEAATYYQRVLELEPKNSTAQAGLIALLDQGNPIEAESRIKTLISRQPDAANLHAALGGLYADQNQWPNAQQAYFQALSLDTSNAEYAFNLAVSLDQMGKPELALDYYQKALVLSSRQGGSIDKTALESRISQLRSSMENKH